MAPREEEGDDDGDEAGDDKAVVVFIGCVVVNDGIGDEYGDCDLMAVELMILYITTAKLLILAAAAGAVVASVVGTGAIAPAKVLTPPPGMAKRMMGASKNMKDIDANRHRPGMRLGLARSSYL